MHLHALLFAVALTVAALTPAKAAAIDLEPGNAAVPFTLIDNRIIVRVAVNGHGPYDFVFDTGGANILDPAVAQELGLELEPDGEAWGAGAARQQAWRTTVDQARLGGVAIRGREFRVVSLQPIRNAIGFRRLDGIIGHELFERFVTDIDYGHSKLQFSEPSGWAPDDSLGAPIKLGFVGTIPALPADVDGIKGTFILDTGDRSTLTLFGPFVERNGLRTRYKTKLTAITGWGIGGPIPADVVRVPHFTVAGHTLTNLVTRMPLLKTGGFAMTDAAGSIGTGVFKRFRVVFDYSRKRMFMAPGAGIDAPDPHDRSGMWLVSGDGGFKVMSVAKRSPADDAGIRIDDIITAVDGRPAAQVFLVELRDRLKQAAVGTKVPLTLKSGANVRDVSITLRDLL